MARFSIDNFLNHIDDNGGLKYTDKYEFEVDRDGVIFDKGEVNKHLMLMCKNINYPNFIFSQSVTNGIVLGRSETTYPTHNVNNDLEATFMVDEDCATLLAFQTWYALMQPGKKIGKNTNIGHRRFAYPQSLITPRWKTTASLKLLDKQHQTTLQVLFFDFYPFSNDVIPMAYDRVAPMEITVRFAYSDYVVFAPSREERARRAARDFGVNLREFTQPVSGSF